jgi:phage terminase large subunit-like protein
MSKRKAPTSSTDLTQEIDAAVERWCDDGLLIRSDWDGSPLILTPLPSGDVHFDLVAVERVLKFFLLLRQLIGRWAGREFRLLDWQARYLIAPVFGIKRADGLRAIRTVWFEIPRKNGKSTICSGLCLYLLMADREAAAEVYAAAGDKPQAGIVFRAARNMASGSKAIADKLGKRGIQRSLLEHPVTGSVFRALSSDGDRQHGLNVHGAVIDEVHVHKNSELVDALETGTGSREQPLILFITTADAGEDGSIYAQKREYVEGVASGTITDDSFYGVVFGVDHTAEDFDPFATDTIRRANPGYNVTVLADYLERKANEARQSPAQLNKYLRLHLNVRTKQTTRWLPLDRWDAGGQLVNDDEWDGITAYGGLDLSSTTDLTSFSLVGFDTDGHYIVHPMFWLPEERADELGRKHNIPFRQWAKAGLLNLTEGNVVDYATVREDIYAEVGRLGCNIAEVAYDPWNATEIVQNMEEHGWVMVPLRQGYGSLSSPCKELERVVMGSTPDAPMIRHGGHPVLRWNVDCCEVMQDHNGNIKPTKPDRRKSTKRIDGVASMVNATARAMLREPPKKTYRAAGF